MSKNFDKWNTYQKRLHESDRTILCNPGNIWWCALGINIGHEQDGDQSSFERPVIILKTFGNKTCLCAPMTTSRKENPFYYPLNLFEKKVFIITSQVKTISTKRLLREFGTIPDEEFRKLKEFIHDNLFGI